MRSVLFAVGVIAASVVPAYAGFDRWTAETEKDPFSGGKKVMVGYMSSLRSGILIKCDSAEQGISVRAIPGFAYVAALAGETPEVQFAIDGNLLFGEEGRTGSVGDNLAAVDVDLSGDKAEQFAKAFAAAKSQVAVKDGISDRPHLLKARGTSKAGAELVSCLSAQKK